MENPPYNICKKLKRDLVFQTKPSTIPKLTLNLCFPLKGYLAKITFYQLDGLKKVPVLRQVIHQDYSSLKKWF